MICDDCTKKDVCRLKEQCNILERDISHSKIEDAITLEIKCKYKEKPYTASKTVSKPYQLPGQSSGTFPCKLTCIL